MQEARRSIHDKSKSSKYNFDEMHILLTERSFGKSLYDTSKSGKLRWNDWHAILFQLIYTIECFLEIGFMLCM